MSAEASNPSPASLLANKRFLIAGLLAGALLYSVAQIGLQASRKAAWETAQAQLDDFAAYDRTASSEAYDESLRRTRIRRVPYHLLRLLSLAGAFFCAFLLIQIKLRERADQSAMCPRA